MYVRRMAGLGTVPCLCEIEVVDEVCFSAGKIGSRMDGRKEGGFCGYGYDEGGL